MGKKFCKVEQKWCKLLKFGVCTYCRTPLTEVKRCPRVSEIETKRFSDVLREVEFDEVIKCIVGFYPGQDKNKNGYRDVYQKLLEMKPKKHKLSDMFISVSMVNANGEEWIDVSGVNPFNKKEYGIEFVEWNDWVSMFVKKETLETFTSAEIAAACLYEMTFYGFDEESIGGVRKSIEESAKECSKKYSKK